MIKHIVMWKLKEENKAKNALEIKNRLEKLNGVIDVIKFLEVGININKSDAAEDVVLVSDFENIDDLSKYQNDPRHIEVGKFVREVVLERKVVDYEY